jgi:hypothetical protein
MHYPFNKAFTIFASANREVAGQTEHYFWLISAPTNLTQVQINLSNSKLTSADPDGYFNIEHQ